MLAFRFHCLSPLFLKNISRRCGHGKIALATTKPKEFGMYGGHACNFDWIWVWMLLFIPLLLVVALVIGRKHALTIVTVLCAVGVAILTFLWIQNRFWRQGFGFCYDVSRPGLVDSENFDIVSGSGGLSASYRSYWYHEGFGGLIDPARPTPRVSWSWEMGAPGQSAYPSRHTFEFKFQNTPDARRFSVDRHVWEVTCPNWFFILLLSVPPALWFFQYRQRRARALIGHCVKCGYDLRASPTKCPECGTPAKKPDQPEPALKENPTI
jgi:hypothetical protein